MPDTTIHDPLGRTILLRDYIWFGHIVKGHPEVADRRSQVEAAIANPQEIQFSSSAADCRVYYGVASRTGRMFVVVADVVKGNVRTSYITTKKKKSGVIEWSR